MKVNIELPFFPGFYESDLENSDTSYWAIKEELEYYQQDYAYNNPDEQAIYSQLTEDDLDFNYKDYEKDVREAWVESFRGRVPDFVLSIGDVEMTSPKYYNFETDRLWADVELRDDWKDEMRHFIANNYDWLQKRIHDDWTSYDGFCFFMENDVDEWDKMLFEEEDARYISTMLGYMMYHENSHLRDDLVMDALEDIYAGSYVFITDEGEEKLQELRDQREEDIREGRITLPDPAQLELPFTD